MSVQTAPPWSQDLYQQGLAFAARAHTHQRLPGSRLPYILHVAQVAAEVAAILVVEPDLDGNLALGCALLHDVLEDTAVTRAELEACFGEAIAAGVVALSKDPNLPKQKAMADSLNRIRQQPREVWLVKLADRITNLQLPPKHWSADKVRGYRSEAQLILEQLGEASPLLAERLREKIAGYPGDGSQQGGQLF
ncbi:MAG: HD domain-containing protein [Candidatus Competibacteraceae bacterium]|nr:HD domain-containing protein [Candidatus Competibacteraceae bacterium]